MYCDYKLKDVEGWESLPDNIKRDFDETFESNYKVKELRKKIELLKKTNNYVALLQCYKTLDAARQNAQRKLLAEKSSKIPLKDLGLSIESLDKISVMAIAIYMACDIIDFFAMDVDSELKKKDKNARFEMFDPIRKVGEEAKQNLRYLFGNTSMYDSDDFNINCDDMRQMLWNKATKVFRIYSKIVEAKEKEQGNI